MKISRGAFCKTLTCAGGAALCGPAAAARGEGGCSPPNDVPGMLTDLSLCVGCRRCEWACKEANGLDASPLDALDTDEVFKLERRTSATALTVVNRFEPAESTAPVFVKRQCMHCAEPACASACPVKALVKSPEGPVVYKENLCIGCRYCMVACPFEIPAYEYDNVWSPKVQKCSMCCSRLEEGEAPACASACPQEAITFGKRGDLLELARGKIRKHPDRYVEHIYGEWEAGGTNWLYVSSVPFSQLGFPAGIGAQPYPELTKGYLSLVPLVHTIWPMLLIGLSTFSMAKKENGAEAGEEVEL